MAQSPPRRLLTSPKLPVSSKVLILMDFIDPLDFPGAETLACPAVKAAAAALRRNLVRQGLPTIDADDNSGVWQSDFHGLVGSCLGLAVWVPADRTAADSPRAWKASLDFMADVLRCDIRPATGASRPKPRE